MDLMGRWPDGDGVWPFFVCSPINAKNHTKQNALSLVEIYVNIKLWDMLCSWTKAYDLKLKLFAEM